MNPKAAAALATMIWGTTFIFVSTLLPHNAIFIAAIRALGGGLPLLLFYRQWPERAWWGRIFVLGTLNFFAFFFIAAVKLPGGVAGTLQSLGPIFTVLIAWPLLGQIPTAMRLGTAICGAIGVMILLTGGAIVLDFAGTLAGIGGALSLALGNVLINRWGRPMPLVVFTAWQLVIGGVELIALAALLGDIPAVVTWSHIGGLAYVALIGTSLAFALWFYAVEKAGATAATPFFLLVPIVAFTLDAMLRGVVPTPMQAFGAAIVLVSLLVGQIGGQRSVQTAR